MTIRKQNKRKPAKSVSVPDGVEATKGEIHAMLEQLTAANLEQLLRNKKVLGRSKLTKKVSMIKALEGLFTPEDFKPYDLGYHSSENMSKSQPMGTDHRSQVISMYREKEGRRKTQPVLGMDIHKNQITYATATPEGIQYEGIVENTPDGINSLIQLYRNIGACIGAMESTAEYWVPVYWQMQEAGLNILIANAQQTKAIMGKKTDKFDARRIALALRDGILRPSVTCTREQYALRKQMRDLVKRDQWCTSVRARIQQIFDKAQASKFVKSLLGNQRGQRLLLGLFHCTSTTDIFELVQEEMSHHRGKVADLKQLRIYATELEFFTKQVDRNLDRFRFQAWLSDYFDAQRKILQLQQEGLRYAQAHPEFRKSLLRLVEIPDVGLTTALAVLAEIIDIAYFPTAKALTKWAGLVPSVAQSGYRKAKMGRLCKAGNKYLRRACWTAANTAATHGNGEDHPIGRYIRHLKDTKNKFHKVAVTAGARKLLTIIHAILNSSEPFRIAAKSEIRGRYLKNLKRKQNEITHMLKRISPKIKWEFVYTEIKARYEEYHEESGKFEQLWKQIMGPDILVPI